MYLFFGTISCLDLRAGWHTTHDLHLLDTELFRQERFCVFLSPPKKVTDCCPEMYASCCLVLVLT